MTVTSAPEEHPALSRTLGVTWFSHRRTTELCSGLNIELIVLATSLRGPLRYLLLGIRTLALLLRRRPEVVLVQNPSLILAALALLLRGVLRYRVIVDAHNEAVDPFTNRQRWIVSLSRWVIRNSDLTIVTNSHLAESVTGQGGRPFVLPDRVPKAPAVSQMPLGGAFNVVLIATFAADEPCAAIFTAVEGADIELFVTGNRRRLAPNVAAAAPRNVRFTGFLDEGAYWALLRSADAVVDLTLKANCIVCGAYEALAVGKPMLLSKNPASLELFGESAIYTDNTPADIRHALARLHTEHTALEQAASRKRAELTERWDVSAQMLRSVIRTWQSASLSLTAD